MNTSKIIFCVALFGLLAATCLAKDIDKTSERYQQATKRFVHVLVQQWGIDPQGVSGETYFLRNFGADDLDIIELVMALEEEFDIEIPDEEWAGITTVDSAVAYILEKQDRPRIWGDGY